MSVIIKLTFPAGRYHATTWGRHVNEGVPEWPPSPWRLLRAIVAVWKRTAPQFTVDQIRRILEPLAQAPRFRLPAHRVAHTRHYMPWEKKGPADRALVFDTFVAVNRHDPLFIGWPDAAISHDDRAVLATLLASMSSFGRAEGWVHAEMLDGSVELPVQPAESSHPDPVPVLCPDPATAFSNEHYPSFDPKRLAKGKVNPADFLFDCPRWHLCLDTETIYRERWVRVPGTRWVNYTRPLEANTAGAEPRRPARKKPLIARFLLDGPVLPLMTDTLPVAEAFRHALLARFQWHCHRQKYGHASKPYQERFRSEVLAGKDADGHCLQQHRHAYYLPTAESDDVRWITHVTVLADDGFGPDEVSALTSLRVLRLGDESTELRVQLVGLGEPADFRTILLGESKVWRSVTPFLASRYPKRNGTKRDRPEDYATPQHFAAHVLRQEIDRLRERRPEVPAVERIDTLDGIGRQHLRPIQFKRFRNKAGDDGGRRPAGAFRITFAAPVQGPIALGHSCHFGLGLFVPQLRH